jgi:hypothetical protein
MIEIKNSLDWPKAESEIRKLGNMMPIFESDTKRVIKHVSAMITELSKLEVDARYTKSKSSIAKCQEQATKINQELKQIQKIHLMSVLSR